VCTSSKSKFDSYRAIACTIAFTIGIATGELLGIGWRWWLICVVVSGFAMLFLVIATSTPHVLILVPVMFLGAGWGEYRMNTVD